MDYSVNSSLSDGDADLDTEVDIEEDDGSVDKERELCALQMNSPNKPGRKAFSDEQVTCLCDYYKRGMIGVGRKYNDLIEAASEETGLTIKQVKDWIKRSLFRKRHAEPVIPKESLPTKKFKRTPWQQFQSEFATTDEGKKAFSDSPANFMKVASDAYKSLEVDERNRLQTSTCFRVKPMSSKDIRREGGKIFQSMQKKFQELDELGYHAFAFGTYGDAIELVGTPSAIKCCTSQIIQYLSAVLIAGNPPVITPSESNSQGQPPKGHNKNKGVGSSSQSSEAQVGNPEGSTSAPSKSNSRGKGHNKNKGVGSSSQSSEAQVGNPEGSTSAPSESNSRGLPPKGRNKNKGVGSCSQSSEAQIGNPEGSTSAPSESNSRGQPSKGSNKNRRVGPSSQSSGAQVGNPEGSTSAPSESNSRGQPSKGSNKNKRVGPSSQSSGAQVSTPEGSTKKMLRSAKPQSQTSKGSIPKDPPSVTISNDHEPSVIHGLSSESPITFNYTESLVLSDPEKTWIKELFLTEDDKACIENPRGWLNDAIIHAAQLLLKSQSQSGVGGFQNPQYGKDYQFQQEVGNFVQVLHVSNSHWITVSNIGCQSDSVNVFDSAYSFIDMDGKKQVCSLMKPTEDILFMDFVNIQHQANGSDCGLFALACATELVYGRDPFLSYWDTKQMRMHLIKCLEAKQITCFPLDKARRIPIRNRFKKTIKVKLHCICRMPYGRADQGMVCCDICHKWFHCTCMQIDKGVSLSDIHWECNQSTCKSKGQKRQ